MRFLYTLCIQLYSFAIACAAPFYEKAKLLQQGRKKTFAALSQHCENKKVIWFHCASLGEYEQGKPLLQELKNKYPTHTFLVTFFSPSGYEVKKQDSAFDCAVYLPADTPRAVRKFLDIVQPTAVFFVKYEYWFNFMNELINRKIPFFYLSVIFQPTHYFFKPYGHWFAAHLQKCQHFFVQNKESEELLRNIGIRAVSVTGDTRFDRVYAIQKQQVTLPFVEEFKGNSKLFVAGSSWQPDEQLLAEVFQNVKESYKLLIAPHLIDKAHISAIKNLFKNEKVVCFSEITGKNLSDYDVLIVDTIGLLSKIYRYADIAHVGGAFATGLHNTLEAAVFGIPLFFGPKYAKFNEAVALVRLRGAFAIQTAPEMLSVIQQFEQSPDFYKETCNICAAYVQENLGSCQKIMAKLPTF